MLSDFEEEARPAPVFKSKRKVNKGKRRVREASGDEDGLADTTTSATDANIRNTNTNTNTNTKAESVQGVQISEGSNISRTSLDPPVSVKTRWARYSALSQGSGAPPLDTVERVSKEQATDLHTPVDPVAAYANPAHGAYAALEDYEHVEHYMPSAVPENLAYKTLDVAPAAKTFRLRESHFRDSPQSLSLQKEYADAYGNVSDEEERRVEAELKLVKEGDDDMSDINDLGDINDIGSDGAGFSDPASRGIETVSARGQFGLGTEAEGRHPRDLEMYDSEVSVEESEPDLAKAAEVAEPEELLRQLTEKVAGLDVGISLKQAKSVQLKQQLMELQTRRQSVVESLGM